MRLVHIKQILKTTRVLFCIVGSHNTICFFPRRGNNIIVVLLQHGHILQALLLAWILLQFHQIWHQALSLHGLPATLTLQSLDKIMLVFVLT